MVDIDSDTVTMSLIENEGCCLFDDFRVKITVVDGQVANVGSDFRLLGVVDIEAKKTHHLRTF